MRTTLLFSIRLFDCFDDRNAVTGAFINDLRSLDNLFFILKLLYVLELLLLILSLLGGEFSLYLFKVFVDDVSDSFLLSVDSDTLSVSKLFIDESEECLLDITELLESIRFFLGLDFLIGKL